jgi:ATP diphosphatase
LELGVDGEQRLQAEELGRMLFAIVNYARRVKMDPEAELQRANQEFRSQFSNLLQSVSDAGQRLKDLDLTTMMQLWDASRAASE